MIIYMVVDNGRRPTRGFGSEGLAARLGELTREVGSAREAWDQGTEKVTKRRSDLETLKGELRTAEDDLDDLIDDVAST